MKKIPFVLYAESEHHLKSLVPVKKKKQLNTVVQLEGPTGLLIRAVLFTLMNGDEFLQNGKIECSNIML